MADDVTVREDPEQHRYEAFVDGAPAGTTYYRDEDGDEAPVRVFVHTRVDPDFEGHGVGSTLAREALADTVRQGRQVVARCPFIAAYLQRHPDAATPPR